MATAIVLPLNAGEAFRPGQLLYTLFMAGVIFAYFGWFWTHGGQTPGMRAWRIRLSMEAGRTIGLLRVAVRLLAGVLTLGLGFFWVCGDPRRRALQDLASGTVVRRSG